MSCAPPATMKAWHCSGYQEDAALAVASLTLANAVPVPSPGKQQVLVKVHFAALSPTDLLLLTGSAQERFPLGGFPAVPGCDAAGEVAALGPGCSPRLKVGDRVAFCLDIAALSGSQAGALADFCACPEGQVSKLLEGVELRAAAGLPLAGLSAYQALFTGAGLSTKGEPLGDVQAGSKVLILGGDRGTGHLAVQLAKKAGATVVTTASPSKLDWLRTLGADRIVDWREQDFDLIYDCVGWASSPEEMGKATMVMRPGGQFITPPEFQAFAPEGVIKERHFKAMVANPNTQDLDVLIQRLASGELEVNVDHVYPFAEAPHALTHSVSGQTNGKVLVSVAAPAPAHGGKPGGA
mmetsp:Transcript_4869/g.15011  ORF Transcript_4869/g.15011 Transcript_4869/m.15011 type:complete len:352 (+) Transcript_4869:63-1118(+)